VNQSETFSSDFKQKQFSMTFHQPPVHLTILISDLCFDLDVVLMFSAINIAPTLSTLQITGSFTGLPIDSRICTVHFTSFAASVSTTNSASEELNVTDFWTFDFHEIGTPSRKITQPDTLILLS
jgi:hypothetical protein